MIELTFTQEQKLKLRVKGHRFPQADVEKLAAQNVADFESASISNVKLPDTRDGG